MSQVPYRLRYAAQHVNQSCIINSAVKWCSFFQKNKKNLDLSYMTDLDLGIVFEGEKRVRQ